MAAVQTTLSAKLIRSNLIIITAIFIAVLIAVSALSILVSNRNLNATKEQIRNSLIAKGKTLVLNNSMALRGMADDNAIMDVSTTVSQTVKNDDDLVYGIYMDADRKPWVVADKSSSQPSGQTRFDALSDSMSMWSFKAEQGAFKMTKYKGEEVLEFSAHIQSDDGDLGSIRYGVTTSSMKKAMVSAQSAAIRSLLTNIAILILIAGGAVAFGYYASRRQASTITRPVVMLVSSAREIANGNYSLEVAAQSDDEIGELSETFETMRKTVKKFTEHLQELIDEKMQQVRDIMNNIDQGLLTVNPDLSINAEYSAASNRIFNVPDASKLNLPQLFRSMGENQSVFADWMALVISRYQTLRWNKLVRLSPVQELELYIEGEARYIRVNYQQVLDKTSQLKCIMVLAQDITEQRRIERRIEEERMRHENEVKTILGIVNNPPEIIGAFIVDSEERLFRIKPSCEQLYSRVDAMRRDFPDGQKAEINAEEIFRIFRDLHTIKGNAGTYGFDMLSREAHLAEDLLEELKEPAKSRRADVLIGIIKHVETMHTQLEQIRANMRMLAGEGDDLLLRIPNSKIAHLKNMCRELAQSSVSPPVHQLISSCYQIDYKPFAFLVKKYSEMVRRVSEKINKTVEFKVECPNSEVPPDALDNLDEAIVHVIRNSLDHGIESMEQRQAVGKGAAQITLFFKLDKKEKVVRIADNGKGIDGDAISARAVEKGLIEKGHTERMSYMEKCNLIFMPGLSTADSATDISGRGMGMDIVRRSIEKLNGRLVFESSLGKGTVFTIIVPCYQPAAANSPERALHA
jgi:signal transduction histidine kinase/HPt (histidine-containing phosphotransfer) domain-containing protein